MFWAGDVGLLGKEPTPGWPWATLTSRPQRYKLHVFSWEGGDRGLFAAWGPSEAGGSCTQGGPGRVCSPTPALAAPHGWWESLSLPCRSARAEQTKIPGCSCLGQVQRRGNRLILSSFIQGVQPGPLCVPGFLPRHPPRSSGIPRQSLAHVPKRPQTRWNGLSTHTITLGSQAHGRHL